MIICNKKGCFMLNYIFNLCLLFITLLSFLVLPSCARQISSNTYAAGAVGETSETYTGTIIHSRMVAVEDKEYLEQNGLGIVGGGLGGAYLGSKVGRGEGNTLATIGGALLGATGGAFAEKALKSQTAMEYVVALDNGQSRTVVQGPEPQFGVGQNVYLIVSNKGRSRVIAR